MFSRRDEEDASGIGEKRLQVKTAFFNNDVNDTFANSVDRGVFISKGDRAGLMVGSILCKQRWVAA